MGSAPERSTLPPMSSAEGPVAGIVRRGGCVARVRTAGPPLRRLRAVTLDERMQARFASWHRAQGYGGITPTRGAHLTLLRVHHSHYRGVSDENKRMRPRKAHPNVARDSTSVHQFVGARALDPGSARRRRFLDSTRHVRAQVAGGTRDAPLERRRRLLRPDGRGAATRTAQEHPPVGPEQWARRVRREAATAPRPLMQPGMAPPTEKAQEIGTVRRPPAQQETARAAEMAVAPPRGLEDGRDEGSDQS